MTARAAVLALALATGAAADQNITADRNAEATKEAEAARYLARTTPNYKTLRDGVRGRLATAGAAVTKRELAGAATACSRQILNEADWAASDAYDYVGAARRLDELDRVLAHPEMEAKGAEQSPSDGGWGGCHEEWFFRVNATYDHIANAANRGERPRYEMRLFDRVNSPEKLRAYFDSVATSDVERTGRDNLRELNESLENLGRLILRGQPSYYRWDPALKGAMREIIDVRLRNRATGWWGPRYAHNGAVQFVDSLSMTFHMISTLDGKVSDLDKVAEHLLAVKDLDYPVGWLRRGAYSNHHEMDVITLFGYCWPFMSEALRRQAVVEIGKVVRWCAGNVEADGAFRVMGDDSVEEEISYGTSLLVRAGYFDRAKRFWTTDEFPEAAQVKERIVGFVRKHLETGGSGGTYYGNTLRELGAASGK